MKAATISRETRAFAVREDAFAMVLFNVVVSSILYRSR
jgi:hypothetical protein